MSKFTVRVMQRQELDLAVKWAADEGWNPGLADAQCYFQADPQGFFVGVLDDEIIGCISAIKYSDAFAFIGFYLVKPEYRGQGYGIQIWQRALDYLKGCNIGLDGVTEQQANYQQSGFQLAYANARFQGMVTHQAKSDLKAQAVSLNGAITPLNQLTFQQIAQYDADFFPCERHAFLQQWIEQEKAQALAYVENGKLMGYGVIRQCLEGYKIAPLFADSPEIAAQIMAHLIQDLAPDAVYFLDVPMCQAKAKDLANQLGMVSVFETARMYTQRVPDIAIERTYGVTSFEIG